jgi:hypothetical protein
MDFPTLLLMLTICAAVLGGATLVVAYRAEHAGGMRLWG